MADATNQLITAWRLTVREAWHRKANFLLSALAVTAAVGLFVAFLTTVSASQRETVRVMRDIGFNLRIVARDTDMDQFWRTGFSDRLLPEDALKRLAAHERTYLTYNHLVGVLQQRHVLRDQEIVLTGLSSTYTAPEQRTRPMGFQIEAGTLHLGFEIARRLGLEPGDRLSVADHEFRVAKCLVESGTDEDIRVYARLEDVQRVLGLEGRINEIKAIDCVCLTGDRNPLQILRTELERILPEAKVIQLRAIADARARGRRTAERHFAFITPVLIVVCAAWVALLAAINVRERRLEIGILRALGHGSGLVALLFLGRAVGVGLLGAVAGYALGTALAVGAGPRIFELTAKSIQPDGMLLVAALVAAPAFAALASFIPAVLAVTLDPAEILREA